MNLYVAGGFIKEIDRNIISNHGKRLHSYHYKNSLKSYIELLRETEHQKNQHLIIDSGAFSAWNNNKVIDIEKYREFCYQMINENHNYFHELSIVNLDVIPGKRGTPPTMEQRKQSIEQGLQNLIFMLQVIPKEKMIHVFHMYEDFKTIDEILKHVDYIGISPANDASEKLKKKWLRQAFDYLPTGVRSHGFAVTSVTNMKEFPWYSVDSATPIFAAGMGLIMTPWGMFKISNKTNDNILGEMHKIVGIENYVNESGICTIDELQNDFNKRVALNIYFVINIEAQINSSGHNHRANYQKSQYDLFGG